MRLSQSVNKNNNSSVRMSVRVDSSNNNMRQSSFSNYDTKKINCSVREDAVGRVCYKEVNVNNRPREKQFMTFSKRLINKDNLGNNKENTLNYVNESRTQKLMEMKPTVVYDHSKR